MYILFEPERETLGGVKRVVWGLNLKDFADIDQIAPNCVTIEGFGAISAPYLKSAPIYTGYGPEIFKKFRITYLLSFFTKENYIYEDRCEKSQLSSKSMDFETSTIPTRDGEVVEACKFNPLSFNIIRNNS